MKNDNLKVCVIVIVGLALLGAFCGLLASKILKQRPQPTQPPAAKVTNEPGGSGGDGKIIYVTNTINFQGSPVSIDVHGGRLFKLDGHDVFSVPHNPIFRELVGVIKHSEYCLCMTTNKP